MGKTLSASIQLNPELGILLSSVASVVFLVMYVELGGISQTIKLVLFALHITAILWIFIYPELG